MPNWKDTHSVTCVLCGGLADERRTVKIQPDEINGAMEVEDPERATLIRDIADALGRGESHQECFDLVLEEEADITGVDLEPRDHR